MGDGGHFFDIQNDHGRIGQGLPKKCPGVGAECLMQFLLRGIGSHKGHLNAHLT